MALNRVQLTINSRMYTVVSDETPEYMEMLGEHINEKIENVLSDGRHIMGERPMVLAALNICDEYYKLAQEKSSISMEELGELKAENTSLKDANNALQREIDRLSTENEMLLDVRDSELETRVIERTAAVQKELSDAQTQVKFLEGQIRLLEEKNEKLKADHDRREQEIINMFNDNRPQVQSNSKKKKNKR